MKSAFVDSNILLCLLDRRDPSKRERAKDIVVEYSGQITISVQVLQETYWACTRKLGIPPNEARASIEVWSRRRVMQPGPRDVLRAIDTSEQCRITFWDAMIVASAAALGCDLLISEGFNHKQVYRGVRVLNPFLA